MRIWSAEEIAQRLQGEVLGDGAVALRNIAPAEQAKSGDLTFAENEFFFGRADKSAASAILIDKDHQSSSNKVLIKVPNARIAFAKVLALFYPEPRPAPGVHSSAVIAASAQIDSSATIGPHCVIGEQVRVAAGVVLHGNNHVGDETVVGEESQLFPQVTVYPGTQIGRRVRIHAGSVIGSDGFGYVFDNGNHLKVPQIGRVIIEDDVEIGANVTVDRGALGPTIIGKGVKIDNLVQIAHSVTVGEHSLIVAQTGIAGSTRVGKHVTLAGQVGVAGHLTIGNQVTIAGQSGVMNDISDNQKWFGTPARPDRQMKRQILALQQLPELLRRVRALERRISGPDPGAVPASGEENEGGNQS